MGRVRLQNGFNLRKAQGQARGRVGVCDHNGGADIGIIPGINAEVRQQRLRIRFDVVQGSKYRIETVGNGRKGHAVLTEGHEGKVQRLIGAVAHKDLRRGHAVALRQRLLQGLQRGIGIETELRGLLAVHDLQHARRRRIG